MASTKKTTNLGLNNWTETDCPKRSDFVSDNLIIDNLLGNHIKDDSLHLSAEEKDRATQPFDLYTYYGTGEATTTIKYNYVPRFAIAFKKNSPAQTTVNGNTVMHMSMASTIGTMGGIAISGKSVILSQSTQAENGVMYSLNNSSNEYMLITFK